MASKYIRYIRLNGLKMELDKFWFDRVFKLLDKNKVEFEERYTGEPNTSKSNINLIVEFKDEGELKKVKHHFKKL